MVVGSTITDGGIPKKLLHRVGAGGLPACPLWKVKKNGDPFESPLLVLVGQFIREPFANRAASHSCTSARMFLPASKKSSNRLGT